MPLCKKCNKKYDIKARNKCHKKGYCSYACYKTTDEFKIMYKKTFIKKRNKDIDVDKIDNLKIDNIFHELKSASVIKSQPQRVKTIRSKGDNEFCRMGTLSKYNRRINFLLKNGIIKSKDDIKSDSDIDRLFILFFDKVTEHGKKVFNGMLKKHGNKKAISAAYRKGQSMALINRIVKMGIDLSVLTKKEFDKISKSIYVKQNSNKNIIEWKKTHIKNHMGVSLLDADKMDDKEINRIYSQYMINRKHSMPETTHNGYKRTKKGFYSFKNIEKDMFFRSSWEKSFLYEIDFLIGKKIIFDISVPKYMYYRYGDLNRKYFPDFQISCINGVFIFEIKPKKKKTEPLNVAKFSAAKNLFGKKFIVLDETSIFGDLRNDITKSIGV